MRMESWLKLLDFSVCWRLAHVVLIDTIPIRVFFLIFVLIDTIPISCFLELKRLTFSWIHCGYRTLPYLRVNPGMCISDHGHVTFDRATLANYGLCTSLAVPREAGT